jgi:hypothetical protein
LSGSKPAKTATNRANAYYLERLEAESPLIYADLMAGKFSSPAAAFKAAGLKKRRTRLQELKNAWAKGSDKERREFLLWLRGLRGMSPAAPGVAGAMTLSRTPPVMPTSPPIPTSSISPVAVVLSEDTKRRVRAILSARSIGAGDAVKEMGYKSSNGSLGMALHRGSRVDADLARALEEWVKANES